MRGVALVLVVLGLGVGGCGGDSSTAEGPVSTASASEVGSTETEVPGVSAETASSEVVAESSGARLVSELPEISGPTVLWFWAPG